MLMVYWMIWSTTMGECPQLQFHWENDDKPWDLEDHFHPLFKKWYSMNMTNVTERDALSCWIMFMAQGKSEMLRIKGAIELITYMVIQTHVYLYSIFNPILAWIRPRRDPDMNPYIPYIGFLLSTSFNPMVSPRRMATMQGSSVRRIRLLGRSSSGHPGWKTRRLSLASATMRIVIMCIYIYTYIFIYVYNL